MKVKNTLVGDIRGDVLAFTAGRDAELDRVLAEADCLGTAAHVIMLSRMRVKPRILSNAQCGAVLRELACVVREIRAGRFRIELDDQDVHLAVERRLTRRLGDLGRRVHTGRSRNDQVALDLRLYARNEVLGAILDTAALAEALLRMGRREAVTPMVGRTHFQPAMPSSVGLWAAAHAESLIEDLHQLASAYQLVNRSPLGGAAGYGVPLPLDRDLTSRLLGFGEPVHTVLHATGGARGKLESVVLGAMSQAMLSVSRLAEDLVLFAAPEFGYVRLPPAFCTGSSIMPQKRNPDVLELVRAKASRVAAHATAVMDIVRRLPSGYNRDLQETKEPFLEGMATTRASLQIMASLVESLEVDRATLSAGFTPEVFATDRALELVAEGVPFRVAYDRVKAGLEDLGARDPRAAVRAKRHPGAPAGVDFAGLLRRVRRSADAARREGRRLGRAMARLLPTVRG
jgi:argininosuccinate lyase